MAKELEFRSVFDRGRYEELYKLLKLSANGNVEFLGEDDKEIHFFILSDRLVKITKNISACTAKITFKGSRIGESDIFEEVEIEIDQGDVLKYKKFFELILENYEYQFVQNLRDNFKMDGVEIALKYSNTWGYHAELEVLLGDDTRENEEMLARRKIQKVAENLGIKILDQDQLLQITKQIDENYRLGNYKIEGLPKRPVN